VNPLIDNIKKSHGKKWLGHAAEKVSVKIYSDASEAI
jgi:hypothetical protein